MVALATTIPTFKLSSRFRFRVGPRIPSLSFPSVSSTRLRSRFLTGHNTCRSHSWILLCFLHLQLRNLLSFQHLPVIESNIHQDSWIKL